MSEQINWREELLDSVKFNKNQENILKNGANSYTYDRLI